jgi:hypothetical protein
MTTLSYSIGIKVTGGPQLGTSQVRPVQAYDRVEVTLKPGGPAADEVLVDLQPGEAARVGLLFISASLYDKAISLVVTDGAGDSPVIGLTEPLLFTGPAITLFGTDPKALRLKNTLPADDASKSAVIDVFVGRAATA